MALSKSSELSHNSEHTIIRPPTVLGQETFLVSFGYYSAFSCGASRTTNIDPFNRIQDVYLQNGKRYCCRVETTLCI